MKKLGVPRKGAVARLRESYLESKRQTRKAAQELLQKKSKQFTGSPHEPNNSQIDE